MNEEVVYPAVVLARMSSARFPGKALAMLSGRTVLQCVIETLRACSSVSHIVVATSSDVTDDPIQLEGERLGVPCFRGSLENVSERFAGAVEACAAEGVYRVNGDSPLVNAQLLVAAAREFSRVECDLVTNIFPRTCPSGMSVELVRSGTYLEALHGITSGSDREHVTSYLYANCEHYRIRNISCSEDFSGVHLAVDTPEDLRRIQGFLDRLRRPVWECSVEEVVAISNGGLLGHDCEA